MYSLFIDTHDALITVALINETSIIKKEKESINSHSIYLLSMIDEVINEANIDKTQIKDILAVNGPGSFTGIRIGLSVAKTLSYALKKPIKTISSLTAYGVSTDIDNKLIIIEDNKGFYYKVMDFNNNDLIEESYIDDITEIKEKYNIVNNKLNLRKIYDYLIDVKNTPVHIVKANYIKKIGVE